MVSCNRTPEFRSILSSKNAPHYDSQLRSRKNKTTQRVVELSGFMGAARQIGRDISSTFSKLEKLTQLAKKRSLFDDRCQEDINELTYIIKQDICSLNKQIAQLQTLSKSKSYKKHVAAHSNSVVVTLQTKLASMSTDFKRALEVRTENMKHERSRREHYTNTAASTSYVAPQEDYSIIGVEGSHTQVQLIDQEDSYIQERANTMQNVESTIVELGGIFQQLALMVKEQEETVQRIDSNVEDANLNIEAAHMEILQYFRSVTSSRYLMLKIFAVLIVFFIVFVVFIA